MDHMKFTMQPEGRTSIYDIDIFQSAADEIVIGCKNTFYHSGSYILFNFPVKVSSGNAWKLYKNAVGNDSGSAADIIKFFSKYEAFAKKTVQYLVFDNKKRNNTLGL